MGSKEKIKLNFLRLSDNLLSKYFIFKRISCIQWLFWLFTKIKKGSRTSLWCTFSAWLFYKNVPYLTLYQWTKFQYHTFFPSQDIKQNELLSSYNRQLMTSWTLRFIFDQPLKQWLTGGKRGEDGNTNIWISRERKELLGEIKNIFHSFWRAIIWREIKNW